MSDFTQGYALGILLCAGIAMLLYANKEAEKKRKAKEAVLWTQLGSMQHAIEQLKAQQDLHSSNHKSTRQQEKEAVSA